MAEPHGEYHSYATAIDTFNQPSGGVYIAGSGLPTSSSYLDDEENISHDLEEFFQGISSGRNIAFRKRPLDAVFVSYAGETGIGLAQFDNETVDRSGCQRIKLV